MADAAVLSTPTVVMRGKGRPKSVETTVAKSTSKVKQPKVKAASHPPASEMVLAAITNLNEKGGTSLQAIKKYISVEYKFDSSKAAIFIRKALVNAVASGKLVRTKGTGASGSFKFPSKDKPKKTVKKPSAKKTVSNKPNATGTTTKPAPKKLKITSKPKKAIKTPKVGTRVAPKRK